MPVTASHIFDFLAKLPGVSTERIEIASPAFSMLRRGLRSVITRLREEYLGFEANETANSLRSGLLEWLTVPVPFDGTMLETVKTLGDPAMVGNRWGNDVRVAYEMACQGAQAVQLEENPVRTRLREVIRDLRARGKTFRIYSHRRARPYFQSLFIESGVVPLSESDFLSSIRAYREAEPFDTIIKVGPLRSWGWGSAPDAIMSAPRFNNLVQVVWSGTADEPGFGYDPVISLVEIKEPSKDCGSIPSGVLGHRIRWHPTVVTRIGNFDFEAAGLPPDEEIGRA